MDKQMLEMMDKLMGQMTDMQIEMKDMKTDMKDMKTDMKDMKSEMNERFDAVDIRFDTVNQHLFKLDGSVIGVGEHFEKLSKITIQIQDDVKKELKYLTHKIHALDREVFIRTDSLQ